MRLWKLRRLENDFLLNCEIKFAAWAHFSESSSISQLRYSLCCSEQFLRHKCGYKFAYKSKCFSVVENNAFALRVSPCCDPRRTWLALGEWGGGGLLVFALD